MSRNASLRNREKTSRMNYRVVLSSVIFASCSLVCSGCATGGSGTGAWFAKKTTATDASFSQEISIARLAERHGNHTSAKKIYRHILTSEPDNQIALHRMGVVAGKEGQYDEAVDYLNQAVAVAPPSAQLLSDLGYVYYLQDNQPLAQQYLEKALQEDPDYQAARTNLAIVYAENGDYERALQNFRATSSEAEALSNLAYIQSQCGDIELAEQNYSRALDIDKKLRPAAEALVQLAQLQGEVKTRPNVSPDAIPKPPAEDELIAHSETEMLAPKSAIPSAQQFVANATPSAKIQKAPTQAELAPSTQSQVKPTAVEQPQLVQVQTARPASTNLTPNPLRRGSRQPLSKVATAQAHVQQVKYKGDSPAIATRATSIETSSDKTLSVESSQNVPAVYQISDEPAVSNIQRPPAASSQIGAVPSASAESFSKQIFSALQSAADKQ